ncbi:MAG TPA: cytochrome c [Candidatus Cybelea sp.]
MVLFTQPVGGYTPNTMGIARSISAALALLLGACTTASYGGNAVAVGAGATEGGDKKAGAKLFSAYCASCHGAQGAGGGVGPSLRDESRRMNFETLASWIEDPEPPMPKLYPGQLNRNQTRDIAAYVQTL